MFISKEAGPPKLEIINMENNSGFKLVVTNYKSTFAESNHYHENNWLDGFIKINDNLIFQFELLQSEELLDLKKWIDGLVIDHSIDSYFEFIDGFIRFKVLKRNNHPYVKFIFDENEKEPILFEFSMDEFQAFGKDVASIASQFPIR